MDKFSIFIALLGLIALTWAADSPSPGKNNDLQTESSAFYGYSPYGIGYGYGGGNYGGYGGYYGLGGYGGGGYGGYALGGYSGGGYGYPGVGYGIYYR